MDELQRAELGKSGGGADARIRAGEDLLERLAQLGDLLLGHGLPDDDHAVPLLDQAAESERAVLM